MDPVLEAEEMKSFPVGDVGATGDEGDLSNPDDRPAVKL